MFGVNFMKQSNTSEKTTVDNRIAHRIQFAAVECSPSLGIEMTLT